MLAPNQSPNTTCSRNSTFDHRQSNYHYSLVISFWEVLWTRSHSQHLQQALPIDRPAVPTSNATWTVCEPRPSFHLDLFSLARSFRWMLPSAFLFYFGDWSSASETHSCTASLSNIGLYPGWKDIIWWTSCSICLCSRDPSYPRLLSLLSAKYFYPRDMFCHGESFNLLCLRKLCSHFYLLL